MGIEAYRLELSHESISMLRRSPTRNSQDQEALASQIRSILAESSVTLIHGVPPDCLSPRVLIQLSNLVGSPQPQGQDGSLVREVKDRGTGIGEGSRSRYSDSREGGNFHTDGIEALKRPSFFALMCVRPAEIGGRLVVKGVQSIAKAMKASPDMALHLRTPYYFDRRGTEKAGEPGTVTGPIISGEGRSLEIVYFRAYIESAHRRLDVPNLTREQLHALDWLDAQIEAAPTLLDCVLNSGDVAIVDNRVTVHARTSFQDSSGPGRLMLRTWIAGASQ